MAVLNWQSRSNVPFPTVRMPTVADLRIANSVNGIGDGFTNLGKVLEEFGTKSDEATLAEVLKRASSLGSPEAIQSSLSDGSLFQGLGNTNNPDLINNTQKLIDDLVNRSGKQQEQNIKGYAQDRLEKTDSALDATPMDAILAAAGAGNFSGLTGAAGRDMPAGAPHEALASIIKNFGGLTANAASNQRSIESNRTAADNLAQRQLEHRDEMDGKRNKAARETRVANYVARTGMLSEEERQKQDTALALDDPLTYYDALELRGKFNKSTSSGSGSKDKDSTPTFDSVLANSKDPLIQSVRASQQIVKDQEARDPGVGTDLFPDVPKGSPYQAYIEEAAKKLNLSKDEDAKHGMALIATELNKEYGGNVPPSVMLNALYRSVESKKAGSSSMGVLDSGANFLASIFGADAPVPFKDSSITFNVGKAKDILNQRYSGVAGSDNIQRDSLNTVSNEVNALLNQYKDVSKKFENINSGILSGNIEDTSANRALQRNLAQTIAQLRQQIGARTDTIANTARSINDSRLRK